MREYLESLRHEPAVSRLRMLEDNADDIREDFYYYRFSEAEIQEMKESNAQADIDLLNLTEELKRITDPIKDKMKILKKRKTELVQCIKEGREGRSGKTFVFHDEEDRKTYVVDGDANVISSGPLTGQRTIYEPIRTATK